MHVTTVPDSLIFLDGQIAFMKSRGFDITVVSSPGVMLEEFGVREAVPVHGVTMPRRITPGRDLLTLSALTRLFHRLRPDIVHAHTPKGGLLGTLSASIARVPVRIYQMRGLPMLTASGANRVILASAERLSCGAAHAVICNSASLRKAALDARLCGADKLRVLLSGSGNGVDSAQRFNPALLPEETREIVRRDLHIAEDAFLIGFVGRLVGDKGIAELAHAWQEVRAHVKNGVLVLVGPYEDRDPVAPDVRQLLEQDPRVKVLGFRRDLPRLYAAMDVLALPTYREGFPNVLLEAQAMQVPVVATRVEGCVDAVSDGLTGTLVAVRSARDLASALIRYAASPERRRAHGVAGREWVQTHFARERLWEAQSSLYDTLLQSRGQNGPTA